METDNMTATTRILEINLISAQNLKPPSANLRCMQTYTLAYIHSSTKLHTRLDTANDQNPNWNDKFLFRVSPDFISGDTSAVSVEIYSVGYIRDFLVGTVRFLLSSCLSKNSVVGTPSFCALNVRRPSGRCHGVLNVAATVYDGAAFEVMSGFEAVSFRDLIGEGGRLSRVGSRSSGSESCDLESVSDGTESTTSSNGSTVLKDCNREMAGNNNNNKGEMKSDGLGLLCGLMLQKRVHFGPSDKNITILKGFKQNKA